MIHTEIFCQKDFVFQCVLTMAIKNAVVLTYFFLLPMDGVIIKIWHLSIVDTGNCEAPFRAGCQPLFVPAGCLLLNYFSLLGKGPSPTPALQPFFLLTGVLHFPPGIWKPAPYLNYSMGECK